MFHSGTQRLIAIWTDLPGGSGAPAQAGFDPSILGRMLPRAFMAERHDSGLRLRVAGGWIEAAFDRPMKSLSWLDLWNRESGLLAHQASVAAYRSAAPVVISAGLDRAGPTVEVTLAPLRGRDGRRDRFIGLIDPAAAIMAVDLRIDSLVARSFSHAPGRGERFMPALAALDGRRIA